tara:strand:+ start:262 stop:864 length:603 start_codon:yes stop_codon:yes gene_type:complete
MYHKLFSIPIHRIDVDDFSKNKNKIISLCYEERTCDKKGNVGFVKNGWESNYLEHENNLIIEKFIPSVVNYIQEKNLFKKGTIIKLGKVWINIGHSGAYNPPRNHPKSDLSGLFWVNVPEHSGDIIFTNPIAYSNFGLNEALSEGFKKSTNFYSSYSIKPLEGNIILFPSFLMHEISDNNNVKDRINISFNIMVDSNSQY